MNGYQLSVFVYLLFDSSDFDSEYTFVAVSQLPQGRNSFLYQISEYQNYVKYSQVWLS